MNEFLYTGLSLGAVFLGAEVVLNNTLVGWAEYRNRRLSDGEVGVIYSAPDSYGWGSNLREPFASLAYIAQPILEPLGDIVFNLPGECVGERIYRWRHPKQNISEQPPTVSEVK